MLGGRACKHAVRFAWLRAFGTAHGLDWFVLALEDCCDIEHTQEPSGALQARPIEPAQCIRLVLHALVALKLLHVNSVVHRAVYPAHALCSSCSSGSVVTRLGDSGKDACCAQPTYKLLGFGATVGIDTALAPEEMLATPVEQRAAAGPAAYLSPEMLRVPELGGYQTDIWSLWVTMFEAVAGAHPFPAETPESEPRPRHSPAPPVLGRVSEEIQPWFDLGLARAWIPPRHRCWAASAKRSGPGSTWA